LPLADVLIQLEQEILLQEDLQDSTQQGDVSFDT
jgi:hypothetical protein